MNKLGKEQFIRQVRSALMRTPEPHQREPGIRPAAVLLPLYWHNRRWNLLYTKRTNSVATHSGQVSFPGGAIDAGDDSAQSAALREVFEEIGIEAQDIEILGSMKDIITITHFNITPFVGRIPWPYPLELNPKEVAKTFGASLDWLATPENLTTEQREISGLDKKIPVHFFRAHEVEVIWGVTAQLTVDFLELVGLKVS
ncbi:MAG: CoA pyrophosphatase [Chloroflexi bacterium]|nr:CoA pyrophosphatase [Chloroflexota bacterium]